MKRGLERCGIAVVAAAAAFAISATTGRSSGERAGFIDIRAGDTARFVGTLTTCVNQKGQVPGGQVTCDVHFRPPRSIGELVPIKFDIALTLRCVEVTKFSRVGVRVLRSGRVC